VPEGDASPQPLRDRSNQVRLHLLLLVIEAHSLLDRSRGSLGSTAGAFTAPARVAVGFSHSNLGVNFWVLIVVFSASLSGFRFVDARLFGGCGNGDRCGGVLADRLPTG